MTPTTGVAPVSEADESGGGINRAQNGFARMKVFSNQDRSRSVPRRAERRREFKPLANRIPKGPTP